MQSPEMEVSDVMPAVTIPKVILRIDQKIMSSTEKIVYCLLYKKADWMTGKVSLFVSSESIAFVMGVDVKTVEKALRKLQKNKFIKKEVSFQSGHYVFLIHESFKLKEDSL